MTPTADQGGQARATIEVKTWDIEEHVLYCTTVNDDGSNAVSTTIFLNAADRAALREALS